MVWVCVPGSVGYAEQWREAQRLLTARRRVRTFAPVAAFGAELCSLSPRWPAVAAPADIAEHEKATLSTVNWVKRRLPWLTKGPGFPSTASIASAPFRARLLELADDPAVRDAVAALYRCARELGLRGERPVVGLPEQTDRALSWLRSSAGPWVYQDAWEPAALAAETGRPEAELTAAADAGRRAARALAAVAKDRELRPVGDHLAVVVQDLDGMGLFLSGEGRNARGARLEVAPDRHREVARELAGVAVDQRIALQAAGRLGCPVYLGGDDLLALLPAATALDAAFACRDLVPDTLPTASSAVLFLHRRAGLQGAVAAAHELLDTAKQTVVGKDALAVGYQRRSGVSEVCVQPWGTSRAGVAAAFAVFAQDAAHPLSPRLVADLARDADELAELTARPMAYRGEVLRLVRRHLPHGLPSAVTARVADALLRLGRDECGPGGPSLLPAARVGVFLRQEAR